MRSAAIFANSSTPPLNLTLNMAPLILIVEDETQLADVLEGYARQSGYRTARAGDGQEAVQVFQTLGPDVVLLDVMLPGLSGPEVLRRIRAQSNVPVLFMSAGEKPEREADGFIAKPFRPRDVMQHIQALLHAGKTAQPKTG